MKNWWDEIAEHERVETIHWLITKQLIDIPAAAVQLTSSGVLDQRMQNIDWNYAFYDPLHDFIEQDTEEDLEMFNAVEQAIVDLRKLESAGGMETAAAQLLQIKHWTGKDMEIQISPVRKETFDYCAAELSIQFIKKLYHRLKSNRMKEDVLHYLSNEIKYGGFDERLVGQVRDALEKGQEKFTLSQESQIGKDQVEVKINIAKSAKNEHYYINSFDLKILPVGEESNIIIQHVPRNKDTRFTLKQGYNLAMERAVGFVHIDNLQRVSETWAVVDKKFTNPDGSPQIKILPASYRYSIENALSKFTVLELKDEDEKAALLNSIRRGNPTIATAERSDGIHVKVLITANPLGRSITMYDHTSGQKINRNDFLVQEATREQSASKERGETQTPGEMEAPELPEPGKRKGLKR